MFTFHRYVLAASEEADSIANPIGSGILRPRSMTVVLEDAPLATHLEVQNVETDLALL